MISFLSEMYAARAVDLSCSVKLPPRACAVCASLGNKRGALTYVVSGLSPHNPWDTPQLATSLVLCQVGIAHYGVRGDSGGVPAR